jgi:hypothetical protein
MNGKMLVEKQRHFKEKFNVLKNEWLELERQI